MGLFKKSSGDGDTPQESSHLRQLFSPGGAGLILISAILAIAIGVTVNQTTESVPAEALTLVRLPGKLWFTALKAVVLPLIVSSMIVAMLRLRKLQGSKGSKLMGITLGYYVLTTFFAVILGLIMANVMLIPNVRELEDDVVVEDEEANTKTEEILSDEERTIADQVVTIFTNFIPENIVDSMAQDRLLAVIVTAVVIGLLIDNKSENSFIVEFAHEVEDIASRMIWGIIMVAPIGIFFLLLPEIMRVDIGTLAQYVGILIGTQITTMVIHWAVVYPGLYLAVLRQNPIKFIPKIFPALITAFGTSSSAATFPVTTTCARSAGFPEEVLRFSLPLGMTINMDGSAIGFPIYTFWMAYSQGQTLGFGAMVLIAVTATLASIGTAPVPSASLVLLVMIARSVGVDPDRAFALIVAIDWITDRFRTAVNVSGDLYGVAILSKLVKVEDPNDIEQATDAEGMSKVDLKENKPEPNTTNNNATDNAADSVASPAPPQDTIEMS